MGKKTELTHDGKLYYSVEETARMLGTTTTKVRALMGTEGWDWGNVRINGRIWLSARDLVTYMEKTGLLGKPKSKS